MVIVEIGIILAIEPLIKAGVEGGNGVAVDGNGTTNLPIIYAIDDCALHTKYFAELRQVMPESVRNANDMATTVAKAIIGHSQPYHTVPWLWSNQRDRRFKTVGLWIGYDTTVMRGDPAIRFFSIVYLKDGRVIALCVNATKAYVQGRYLAGNRGVASADALEHTPSLKELVSLPPT